MLQMEPDEIPWRDLVACHIIPHHYSSKTLSNSSGGTSSKGSDSFRGPKLPKPQRASVTTVKSPAISKPPSLDFVQISPQPPSEEESPSGSLAWEALCMYAGAREKLCKLLDGDLKRPRRKSKVNATYNGLLLLPQLHQLFDQLRGWFEHEILNYLLNL